MIRRVLLVRHTQVVRAWQGRCYGRSDIGLSRAGRAHAVRLAAEVEAWRPDAVVHSGLRRAALLAKAIEKRTGIAPVVDTDWQERDFGSWEGRSWNAIYRATGNAMDGMIDDPAGFRPGGGETTLEMAARALAAFDRLGHARTAVITHGGPIAAILGTLRGIAPREWPKLVPECGCCVEIGLPAE